jgi:hypothetical protein
LTLAGASLNGYDLGYAAGVSADGKVVAGAGANANGVHEAWIVRLP